MKLKFYFRLKDREIISYFDTDFVKDKNDKKSTSGYVFLFSGTTIFWRSKKQNFIAKHEVEAKYIACSILVNCKYYSMVKTLC